MKKYWLLFALVILALCVAGCACKHENVVKLDGAAASCTVPGMTEELFCPSCEEVIKPSTEIPALGHTPEAEPRNVREATCSLEGYTGDSYCSVCGTLLASGETTPKVEHTPGSLEGASEPSCTEKGHTGNIYCTVCRELLEAGESIPMLEHVPGEVENAYDATCAQEGYTGNIPCTVCGRQLSTGEFTAKLEHTPAEPTGAYEPTCTKTGYTGDIYCAVCEQRLSSGESIAKLDHTPAEPQNAYDPTCTNKGYTGDIYCAVCGNWVASGEYTDPLGHIPAAPLNAIAATCTQEGYTGDIYCSVCEAHIEDGVEIPKTAHTYENYLCTGCGWMSSGLYVEGELMYDWPALIELGYVRMNEYDESRLDFIHADLIGHLVIDESVDEICSAPELQLTKLWIPSTVTNIRDHGFKNSALEEVVIFGGIETLPVYAFYGCTSLKSVDLSRCPLTLILDRAFEGCTSLTTVLLPDTIIRIDAFAFYDCTSLVLTELPASLRVIIDSAFENCAAITEISLPEGLEDIGDYAFYGANIAEVVLPSTITDLMPEAFGGNTSLLSVDASALDKEKLTLYAFNGCTNLSSIKLSANISEINTRDYHTEFVELPALTRLELVEGNAVLDVKSSYITEIVWPVTLVDGTSIPENLPNLATVYYRGNEFQWNMVSGSKDITAEVIFEYTGD